MKGNQLHHKYRVGVFGLGKMGSIRVSTIRDLIELDLVTVCDISSEHAKKYPYARYFCNYKEALETNLDIVFVCTYNNVAPKIVISALNKGCHVFCEKPPGRTLSDVEKIIEAEAGNTQCKLMFGFNHRWHYAVSDVKLAIDSGKYGRILWMRGVYGKSGSKSYERIWRNDKKIAGAGILLDQGIHMVDLFRYFAGEFLQISSVINTSYWNIDVEDNVFALLHNNKSNITAMLHSSATQWKNKFSLEICLTSGLICINGLLTSSRSYGEESISFHSRDNNELENDLSSYKEEIKTYYKDDSWELELNHFFNAIKHDTDISVGNSSEAWKTMELIDRIYKNNHTKV